jgi:4'-phosphopantetheinyl transferase
VVSPSDWRFETGPAGKPAVSHPATPLSFSLSHARGLVACAIAPGIPVGVAVEPIDRPVTVDGIAQRFFSPREVSALARCANEERASRFIELWTLKEAFLKATGMGLSQPLDAMSFEIDDGAVAFDPPAEEDGRLWHFALFAPTPRGRLAVAARSPLGDAPRFIADLAAGNGDVTLQPYARSDGRAG